MRLQAIKLRKSLLSKECRSTGKAGLSRDDRKDAVCRLKYFKRTKVKYEGEGRREKTTEVEVLPGRVSDGCRSTEQKSGETKY